MGGAACWCSAGALLPPPLNRPPIAWPIEEPTATPLGKDQHTLVDAVGESKTATEILTQQWTPSGRTDLDRHSVGLAEGPAEFEEKGGEIEVAGGLRSSEDNVVAGLAARQREPELLLLAW